MNVRFGKNKRKAISPVLATVILIAITLIAAIAIAGFVFGLFGSFTSSANVSASVTSCQYNGTHEICDLSLINSGSANTGASSCSMTYGGATVSGTVTLFSDPALSTAAANIKAGVTTYGICTSTGGAAGAGVRVTGSISTTNGGSVPFTGTAVS
jgi:archaeal type IV pilus assembly protein PilA